jgi:hypothetical protein
VGSDLQKGTTYATGGVGGAGSITSANLNAHVDDATIQSSFISAKAERVTSVLSDNLVVEAGGSLYRMQLGTLQAGSVIQTVVATPYTANVGFAGQIPLDDTIPQITEGLQILSLSITPRSSSSQIRLTFNGFGSIDTNSTSLSAALFRTGNANALKTTSVNVVTANFRVEVNLDWVDTPGVATAQTYTIRVGPSGGTARMNGSATGRTFGGSAACTLVAQEIKV